MKHHPLAYELQKLRISSKNSVIQGTSYSLDELQEYLHIEREIEKNLIDIIITSSSKNSSQLILICGNVGDGKSHTLSLINKVLKDQIGKFKIHNDATESFKPSESPQETLLKILDGFRDENIHRSDEKLLLAINLGTLNNFLDKYKSEFSKLYKYVDSNKIFESDEIIDSRVKDENINHVNFTEYKLYSLTEEGPKSQVISELLKKISNQDESNPIYREYLKSKEILNTQCPICTNYELLFNEKVRISISNLLIQSIIKEKEIISVRSLLNFFYDILVPVGLKWQELKLYEQQLLNFSSSEHIKTKLFNYLFDNKDLSSIFDKLSKLDPCHYRSRLNDENIINIINSNEPIELFKDLFPSEIIDKFKSDISTIEKNKPILIKTYLRLTYLHPDSKTDKDIDPYFIDFTKQLFGYNIGRVNEIEKIYDLVEEAARKWYGDPKKKNKVILNIGNNQTRYRVFKEFRPMPDVGTTPNERNEDHLIKFLDEFKVTFKLENNDSIDAHIDYSLYKILRNISQGYRPNKRDNNNYPSFLKLIKKLKSVGVSNTDLDIDKINIGQPSDFKLSKSTFGKFKFDRI